MIDPSRTQGSKPLATGRHPDSIWRNRSGSIAVGVWKHVIELGNALIVVQVWNTLPGLRLDGVLDGVPAVPEPARGGEPPAATVAVHAHGHVVDLVERRPGPSRRLDVGIVVHDLEGGKDPARFSGPRQTEVKGQLRGSRRRYRDTLDPRQGGSPEPGSPISRPRLSFSGAPTSRREKPRSREPAAGSRRDPLPGTDLVHRYGGLSLNGRGQEKQEKRARQWPAHRNCPGCQVV